MERRRRHAGLGYSPRDRGACDPRRRIGECHGADAGHPEPEPGPLVLLSRTALTLIDDAMPLYEYEVCDGDCAICGGKFTLRRPVDAPELTRCPACKKPVRKIISSFNTPTKLKPLSISDAKQAGFTVLKRVSKGEYERQ